MYPQVLENIKFLVEHGNVTTYQWKYGEKPISVEEPQLDIKDDDEENAVDGEIDFGDGGEIDFGGGDDIDFGGDEAEIDFGDSGAEIDFGDGGEIDFDIEGVDTSTIVVEEGGMAGGVARDDEALSLLDNRRTRTLILDELEVGICFSALKNFKNLLKFTFKDFIWRKNSEGFI